MLRDNDEVNTAPWVTGLWDASIAGYILEDVALVLVDEGRKYR